MYLRFGTKKDLKTIMSDLLITQRQKRDEIAKKQNEELAENLNKLRKEGVKCDGSIEVRTTTGKASSSLHYAVALAASPYCKRCINNHSKEIKITFGNMKCFKRETDNLKRALEQCIEFMYIGRADIREDTAGCITMISNTLQLKRLEDMGFETMYGNLATFEHCSVLLWTARCCQRKEFEAEAIKKWISLNLQRISSSNECNPENMWKSALNMFQSSADFKRECQMLDVLKVIEIEKADCKFLLDVILTNKVTQDLAAARYIFQTVCKKIEEQPSNLTTENYFIVKHLLEKYSPDDKSGLKERLVSFMINNFDNLVQKDGFLETNQDEVTSVFSSPQLTCTEKIKFDSIVKWVGYRPQRANIFPTLFNTINLQDLSERQLIDIKKDPLVENNASLVSSVFDAMVNKREASASPQREDEWGSTETLLPAKNSLIP